MNKRLKLDKTSRRIIYFLIIYAIVVVAVFSFMYFNKKGSLYIITSDYKIKYIDGDWLNITSVDDYNMQECSVYDNDSYLGKYKLLLSNKFYLYDENGKPITASGNVIAYRGSIKMSVLNTDLYMEALDTDNSYIKQALDKANIENVSDYEVKQKTVLDVDNDGIDEKIYVVSNVLVSDPNTLDGYRDTKDNTIFSILFMVKDDKIYIIDSKKDQEDYKYFEMSHVIDIKEDGKIELIYLDKYLQTDYNQCVKIYDLNKEKTIKDFCK